MKKGIAVYLLLIMVLLLAMPANAQNEVNEFQYELLKNGTIMIMGCINPRRRLIIPQMSDGRMRRDYHIPQGVETVAYNAFANATIWDIYFPRSLRSFAGGLWFMQVTNIFVEEGNAIWRDEDGVLLNSDGTKLIYFPSARKQEVFTNANMQTLFFPDSLVNFPSSNFFEWDETVVHCNKGSAAEEYCTRWGISCETH